MPGSGAGAGKSGFGAGMVEPPLERRPGRRQAKPAWAVPFRRVTLRPRRWPIVGSERVVRCPRRWFFDAIGEGPPGLGRSGHAGQELASRRVIGSFHSVVPPAAGPSILPDETSNARGGRPSFMVGCTYVRLGSAQACLSGRRSPAWQVLGAGRWRGGSKEAELG